MKVIQNFTLTFNFVKKKIINILETTLMYKAKQTMMTKRSSKKSLHILEDGTSGVQVGDFEQVIVFFLNYD